MLVEWIDTQVYLTSKATALVPADADLSGGTQRIHTCIGPRRTVCMVPRAHCHMRMQAPCSKLLRNSRWWQESIKPNRRYCVTAQALLLGRKPRTVEDKCGFIQGFWDKVWCRTFWEAAEGAQMFKEPSGDWLCAACKSWEEVQPCMSAFSLLSFSLFFPVKFVSLLN